MSIFTVHKLKHQLLKMFEDNIKAVKTINIYSEKLVRYIARNKNE